VAALLPKTKAVLVEIQSSVKRKKDLAMYLAQHAGLSPRTPDWIRSNGICMEHMVPRRSTLPQAGQGGTAQHKIRKGEMVVPSPLLHIMDQDALALHDRGGNRIGTQLLLNYCFGHAESSMLLCPVTNAALINHCSKRTKECGRAGPNADYRWSSGWDPTSDAWRNRTLDDIAEEPGRGLAFEIFALRDIEPGEEVFMDYGIEWEKAWKKHVTTWKPAPGAVEPFVHVTTWRPAPGAVEPFVTVKEANEKRGPILDELVSGNLRKEVDHPHLFTGCQYWRSAADSHRVYSRKYSGLHTLTDDELMERFADNGKEYAYSRRSEYSTHSDKSHWPCSVLLQEDGGTYVVQIHQNVWEDELPWGKNNVPRLLFGYPRESIHYFVKPYASDQHLPGVFRHPIGIRDEMFPAHWKNLAKTKPY
jgi:hypothetical protein